MISKEEGGCEEGGLKNFKFSHRLVSGNSHLG